MSHPDDGQLHALVDGELSPAEAAELDAHFRTCDDCRRRFDEARSLLGESDRLVATLEVPPRAEAPKLRARTGPDYRLLGLAASALLVVTVGWLTLRPHTTTRMAQEQAPAAMPSSAAAPAAETVQAMPPSGPRKDATPEPAASNEVARRAETGADEARQRKAEMAKETEQPLAGAAGAARPQAVRVDTPPARAADGVALNDLPPWKAKVAPTSPPPAAARFHVDGLDVVSSTPLPGGGIRLVYSVNGTPVEFDQVPASTTPPGSDGRNELAWPRDDLRLTLRSKLGMGELERLRQLVR